MAWSLHRWTWQLDGPLYVGQVPAGTLNRCRLYVPARPMWGAVTAELARLAAVPPATPDYAGMGAQLQKSSRFSYLFPAELSSGRWVAWLPRYERTGLAWCREDGRSSCPDRTFRRRLLSTRPGTAIDPGSDSAADGSLRETECINSRWRDHDGPDDQVALVGYVLTRDPSLSAALEGLEHVFVGGDTRYGLGALRRLHVQDASTLFGAVVDGSGELPVVSSSRLLAHSVVEQGKLRGAHEVLTGWDRGRVHAGAPVAWVPGSVQDLVGLWGLTADGRWVPEPATGPSA